MNPRELFGVLLRFLAVYMGYQGLLTLQWSLRPTQGYSTSDYLVVGVCEIILAFVVFILADPFAAYAYPPAPSDGEFDEYAEIELQRLRRLRVMVVGVAVLSVVASMGMMAMTGRAGDGQQMEIEQLLRELAAERGQ